MPSAIGSLKSFVGMDQTFCIGCIRQPNGVEPSTLWIELVLAQGGVLDIPLCVSYSLRTIVYCFVYISNIEISPVFILSKNKIDSLQTWSYCIYNSQV